MSKREQRSHAPDIEVTRIFTKTDKLICLPSRVHRDVSLGNIFLPGGSVDRAKLMDFEIAKSMDPSNATVIGTDFAGKYSYVSPEQVGLFGGWVDLRSAIYSLVLVPAAAAIGCGKKLDRGSTTAAMIAARQQALISLRCQPLFVR
jgi:serine/threonine protein kinase